MWRKRLANTEIESETIPNNWLKSLRQDDVKLTLRQPSMLLESGVDVDQYWPQHRCEMLDEQDFDRYRRGTEWFKTWRERQVEKHGKPNTENAISV